MYDQGRGVPQNNTEAVKWVRLAAEQGEAAAQFGMGAMYLSGRGVPEDIVYAYAWFNLAAARGEKGAAKLQDGMREHMTPEQIAEAQQLSQGWVEKNPKLLGQ